ncbi:ABC transporter substrate-binding protein [Clostridium aminobutyricum]|uniref:ABC transporter substrate-binding protein n=1 Tax=Clostridium aminobutyricum TaxID=33953 RepID=A0A939D9F9_CLOAM|nr:ABC transporter substrate-binding protein [Clostridium aminobutyricum]MBN7773540.1 ABC transporter substrate-binding protein [Clostridium aminobutyricum]
MKRYGIIILVALVIMVSCLVTGCGSTETKNEEMSLKIGLMPAVDSAPILLAEKNGYFKNLGLDVELQIFNNAQDRQSALQTQTIDGAITDLIAVAVNVDGGFDIKATTMTNGVFPVLSKEGAENKREIKVGMMEVSVTNFLIDEWLGDKVTIEKVYINDIPARLAAIGSGQLDMGLFPEPMASMGELNGLKKNTYQTEGEVCPDVMVFTGKALNEKEEAVKLFHEAYNRAVDELNKNPQAARDILMEKIPNLKPEIKDKIILPEYTEVSLPDDPYIDRIIQWTSEVMKKDLKVSASDLVERKFAEQ